MQQEIAIQKNTKVAHFVPPHGPYLLCEIYDVLPRKFWPLDGKMFPETMEEFCLVAGKKWDTFAEEAAVLQGRLRDATLPLEKFLAAKAQYTQILDVRPSPLSSPEWPGSRGIGARSLDDVLAELDAQRDVVVLSQTGGRALGAALYMRKLGWTRAYALAGGLKELWLTQP